MTSQPRAVDYVELAPSQLPMALLLEADPDEAQVHQYLEGAWGFAAQKGNQIVAACVVKLSPNCQSQAELHNIGVLPEYQQQGIGSGLLRFVIERLRQKSLQRIELGTGSFGHQLGFYQRHGFRVEAIWRDHFLNNYSEPIYENGIQHKDMLRLGLTLSVVPER
ncbi:GNAT family N-acetyltransferase [Ferrimonas aestuarii]|nr:GNAT family N-acetyltransferase [Ferrimonas aestuarii]